MAAFILKTKYFKFNREVKHQISGTVISTKFARIYDSILMDEIEAYLSLIHKNLSPCYGFDV